MTRPPASPIRVLHVFGAMDRGGAEMRTVEVLRQVDRGRIASEFCALSGRAGSLDVEIRSLGGEVHPCRLDAGFVPRFVALLRRRRIDVVHSHVHLTSGLILAIALLAGVPTRIAHFRSTSDDRGHGLVRRGYRAAMRRLLDASATQILGVAAGVLDAAWPEWHDDPRANVIYSGVDTSRFRGDGARAELHRTLAIPDDARVIVQVARFNPPKNQPFAIDVIAGVPGAHLVLVGRGGTPLEAETRRRVEALGVGDRVHFVGERTDVDRFLCGAELSLLTSTHEGLPGVVLESLAAGTPVVASALPGVLEIADVVPGVHVHGLDESAARWSATVASALAAPRDPALRDAFAASRFSLAASTAALTSAWEAGR